MLSGEGLAHYQFAGNIVIIFIIFTNVTLIKRCGILLVIVHVFPLLD